ncbi:Inactive dipeptidyl peptidase 10 [Operophtera brumata]|uniref:Inactive dipeptidyl peptidase 10 n=1 Tax=Operophtera brumata TaxID=104452 RepID=A0A0L7LLE2_OPEBR|nr:Inactive dipeptidyl peptidase 10 [Operophtera brumata]
MSEDSSDESEVRDRDSSPSTTGDENGSSGNGNKRRKRKPLLVIAAVLGLIVFSIALLTPAGDGGRVKGRRPTLQHLLQNHYTPFNGTWLSGIKSGVTTPPFWANDPSRAERLLSVVES